jgi:hypothetical protein
MSESDTVRLAIEDAEGNADEIALPEQLVSMLAEAGQTPPEVVGDLAVFSCAQRVHATLHHADGEVDPAIASIEDPTMELFEDRFGMSFDEATGHGH